MIYRIRWAIARELNAKRGGIVNQPQNFPSGQPQIYLPGQHPQNNPTGQPQMYSDGQQFQNHPQAQPQMYPQAQPQMYPQAQPQMYPQAQPQNYPQAQPQNYPQAQPQNYPQAQAYPTPRRDAEQPYNQVPVGYPISGPAPQPASPNTSGPNKVSDEENTGTQPLLPGSNTDV